MKRRILPMVGVTAAALAFAATLAPVADASGTAITPGHVSTAAPDVVRPRDACYAQLDDDSGVAVVSQKFERLDATFNARDADDFTLASSCTVQSVDIPGTYFNGAGPAQKVQVMFLADNAGSPGAPLATETVLEADLTDTAGTFHVPFVTPVALDAGTYWISVRIRMDFSLGGEWGWLTNVTQRGAASVWKNPQGGFMTKCKHWTASTLCIDSGEGPDDAFSINDAP